MSTTCTTRPILAHLRARNIDDGDLRLVGRQEGFHALSQHGVIAASLAKKVFAIFFGQLKRAGKQIFLNHRVIWT